MPNPKASFSWDAIGTHWLIESVTELSPTVRADIKSITEDFDVAFSRFRHDSLVSRIAQSAGTYTFPNYAAPLIDFYHHLYAATNGQVTPLIGNMLSDAGYDAEYSFKEKPLQPVQKWEEAMQWSDTTVATTQPILLDFGAAGKGYLVDLISTMLKERGVTEFLIDASGDMYHYGQQEHIIGLENPYASDEIIGTMLLKNGALCASATNRRRWGNGMHHVFDPTGMRPTEAIVATWVTSASTMIADGLATALFFAEPDELAIHYDYQYVQLATNGTVRASSDLQGELYL